MEKERVAYGTLERGFIMKINNTNEIESNPYKKLTSLLTKKILRQWIYESSFLHVQLSHFLI